MAEYFSWCRNKPFTTVRQVKTTIDEAGISLSTVKFTIVQSNNNFMNAKAGLQKVANHDNVQQQESQSRGC